MKALLITTLILWAASAAAQFGPWQKMLNAYVTETAVPGGGIQTAFDYEKAFADPNFKTWLDEQDKILGAYDRGQIKTKEQFNAFYINAYNFVMVGKIYKDGRDKKGKLKIASVKDLGSFFNPYKAFTQKDRSVAGTKMTLDEIEKGTLLGKEAKKKGWKDARIHFAVNCASVGCPPLRKQIYTAENVNAMLDENTKKSMLTKRHLMVKGKTLHLTHLFKWYDGDFKEQAKSVKDWVLKYIDNEDLKKKVIATNDIEFITYDWKLNKPGNFKADGSF